MLRSVGQRWAKMEDHDERTAARPSCGRFEAARNPGLPADQGPARIRRREAGADFAVGQARLPDPGRHPDHAPGGTPRPGATRVTSPFRGVQPASTTPNRPDALVWVSRVARPL